MNGITRNIVALILLLTAQGAIDNFISTGIYIHLCLCLYLILTLPPRMNTVGVMFIAFITGLAVDVLGNNIVGMAAAGLTAAALLRKSILEALTANDTALSDNKPSMEALSLGKFTILAAVTTAIYLLVFLLTDSSGIKPVGLFLIRFTVSLLVNTLIITGLFFAEGGGRRR